MTSHTCKDMEEGKRILTIDLSREASKVLNIQFKGINHNFEPKCEEVTLDQSFTFKIHIKKLQKNLRIKVNLVQKLAETE